ncbi:MAG: thiamine-phosphate kinase [Planctomycetota bacterium]|nr:thiamine-phosphate kinase [Planctomycetota bacterium]
MREAEFLKHVGQASRGLASVYPRVIVPPGDDCAVLASPPGPLVLTVDQVIQGRHFWLPENAAARASMLDLACRKGVARSMSDLAAMGATPWCMLATLGIPQSVTQEETHAMFNSLSKWGAAWDCPLVGGDLSAMPPSPSGMHTSVRRGDGSPLHLSVTAIGVMMDGRRATLRSGARPGDGVYVTGSLGGSLEPETGLGHHLSFEPRIHEARELVGLLGSSLHAMMDISDGLGIDGARIADASAVTMELDATSLPASDAARARHADSAWRAALGDGEDYELLFCASGDAQVPAQLSNGKGGATRVTRVGRVVSREPGAPACVVRTPDGHLIDASGEGFEHGRL